MEVKHNYCYYIVFRGITLIGKLIISRQKTLLPISLLRVVLRVYKTQANFRISGTREATMVYSTDTEVGEGVNSESDQRSCKFYQTGGLSRTFYDAEKVDRGNMVSETRGQICEFTKAMRNFRGPQGSSGGHGRVDRNLFIRGVPLQNLKFLKVFAALRTFHRSEVVVPVW